MTYPPPNPYDPNQSPGYGQPSAPQHYTTDADPYSRPDPYGPGVGYPSAPNHPASAPPGQPYSPGPAYPQTGGYQQPPVGPPGGAFQPGQAAPPPPGGGSSNTPLIITLIVVVVAVIGGGIVLALNMGGGDEDPDPQESTSEAATSEAAEETTEAEEPSEEEATTEGESVYRVPAEGECIENNPAGFYVVDCSSDAAYWEVLKVVQSPADPEPTDPAHSVAAADACEGTGNTNYYYTDTAIAAGRDWDPDLDSITAVYCVKEV
ncbi:MULTISPECIES: hypothetical protein [Glycomyces]|uniref:Uncharacterized protein n=2 Tax=Glycomyces TaxID=58113 RepID=A0A9X3SVD8_9ACTN|nr:hypothetical protein [Glycomyces lechevalierae]MDA1386550.1 hypothetical protein [Glycomyces lechevalierae]MDR7340617.1 hypothetical protein [Glycomyces lechevalierae]